MGRRHAGYGVRNLHFAIVGTASLETFPEVLGATFTTEACEAWAGACYWIAGCMKAGANAGNAASPISSTNPAPTAANADSGRSPTSSAVAAPRPEC